MEDIRTYIGARYVPRFFNNSNGTTEWVAGVAFEPLTIVTENGNSYTSRKFVPANIGKPSENPAYWASTGIYQSQIEQYRAETQAALAAAQNAQSDVDTLEETVEGIQGSITTIQNNVTALGSDVTELENEISQLEVENKVCNFASLNLTKATVTTVELLNAIPVGYIFNDFVSTGDAIIDEIGSSGYIGIFIAKSRSATVVGFAMRFLSTSNQLRWTLTYNGTNAVWKSLEVEILTDLFALNAGSAYTIQSQQAIKRDRCITLTVMLTGVGTLSSLTAIGTIKSGYRPSANCYGVAAGSGGYGRVGATTAGAVQLGTTMSGSNGNLVFTLNYAIA